MVEPCLACVRARFGLGIETGTFVEYGVMWDWDTCTFMWHLTGT